jgi:HSP20 family protein
MVMTKKGKDANNGKEEKETVTGLGGLFRGLGGLVELLGEVVEQGERHIERQGEFPVKGLGDQARGVYGFSIRTGLGGQTQVQRFGNVRATAKGPVIDDVREPLLDLFDEDTEIVITAELPGVSEDSIATTLSGDTLSLSTTGAYRYAKTVALPTPVDPESLTRNYRNGILQIRLKKA